MSAVSISGLNLKTLARDLAKELRRDQWPEIMTFETAGRYMDRSARSIEGLVARGVLPAVRMDGRPQVRKMDIDRIAERSTE